jgi:subtilisin family serine protease
MQPDITAPGVDVIAAYSGAFSPTGWSLDDRRVRYDTLSGTSMACPLVSGIVGLLKTKHPSWTPSMMKSAIMTTGELQRLRTSIMCRCVEPCILGTAEFHLKIFHPVISNV